MAELIGPRARRILFDTSALYAPHHRILIHRFASRENPAFTPLWSEWILAGLYYSLAWSWAATARSIDNRARGAMAGSARQMLTHMLEYFEIVTLRGSLPFGVASSFLPDLNDRHLYAAAVLGAPSRSSSVTRGWSARLALLGMGST